MTILRNYDGAWNIQALTTCFLMLCQTRTLFGEICQFPVGGSNTIDLTNIHTVTNKSTSGNIYQYNCAGIDDMASVVICQQPPLYSKCSIAVGTSPAKQFKFSDGILIIQYYAPAPECSSTVRKGIVNVVCGPETATFSVLSEDDPTLCTYNFKISTKNACFSSSGGMAIDVGTLLLILFFLFIVIYLVAGILINHFVFDAVGVEMIPNLEFWKDFPALVADGFRFVFRKCRRSDQTYDRI